MSEKTLTDAERETLLKGMASIVLVGPMGDWWDAAKNWAAAEDFVVAVDQYRQQQA